MQKKNKLKKKKHKKHSYPEHPGLLICPIHKIKVHLLRIIFRGTDGRSKMISTKVWYWCRKCKKPFKTRVVII